MAKGGYFDSNFYTQQYGSDLNGQTPLEHFKTTGAAKGYSPFQGWDSGKYLDSNTDVKAANYNPLEHYAKYGIVEGRGYEGMPVTAVDFNAQQVQNPQMPTAAKFTPAMQTPQTGEFIQSGDLNVGQHGIAGPVKVAAQTSAAPGAKQAETYQATQVNPNALPQMQGAQGTVSDQSKVQAEQGSLSDETKASMAGATGEVDPRSLVQNQYAQLMDFPAGEIPAWAKGAAKTAMQKMAARGIGGSTMAGEAVTAALMQAAMPIAAQDAKVFESMTLTNLSHKQQAAMLKAGYLAQMDMKNLDNRQAAAVLNAQAFLQTDLKTLDNNQQAAVINTQARHQALFSNQAADNVAKQTNAASINQVNQFYDNLGASVDMFNSAQNNEMLRFNSQQELAVQEFNSKMADTRDQFNKQNQLLIEQSNINYLRGINTENTKSINQANLMEATQMYELSSTALANQIQLMRDNAAFIWQSGENAASRANNIAIATIKSDADMALENAKQRGKTAAAVGGWVAKIFGTAVQPAINKWFT